MAIAHKISRAQLEQEALVEQDAELELFLESVIRLQGYDFTGYARTSLKRRVLGLLQESNVEHILELIPLLVKDGSFNKKVVDRLTVNLSELFRDPFTFDALRKKVFPYLRTFPRLDIWIAGCATGEEVYSIAILLEEAGLLDRCYIHATDISEVALSQAASGMVKESLDDATIERYKAAGGQASLSDYLTCKFGKSKLKQSLLGRITFHRHDLVQQPVFTSAQLVLCRNVLIYFNTQMHERVLNLLFDSMVDTGYLMIGSKESLDAYSIRKRLDLVDKAGRIYHRKA